MVQDRNWRTMTDLDEAALKAEIDQISTKIDDIMKKVERLYPSQHKPAEHEQAASNDKPLTSQSPSG
jgi:outer membrane murein-binding lipoprotein Lpp